MNPKVSIIMGSTSDLKIMEAAAEFLDQMEIPYEINALSAHRVPEQVMDFAKNARSRGVKVIIAGAGGAAHLPGVIAALTPLPVIGIPIPDSFFPASDFHFADAFWNPGCNDGARWSQKRSDSCR